MFTHAMSLQRYQLNRRTLLGQALAAAEGRHL